MCLRAQSKFSMEDLQEGIDFAHAHGKKIYLTLNLFMHNRDVEKLPKFVETLRQLRPDGVLIADPGVFQYVREMRRNSICSYPRKPTSVPRWP